ncbi:MAG: PQQ-like beta-propeller repeat protein, partial [Planctomycetes bacterium]|nr:PQQ-like beta-propeller repeat protein [Planctomycetota bacterium]
MTTTLSTGCEEESVVSRSSASTNSSPSTTASSQSETDSSQPEPKKQSQVELVSDRTEKASSKLADPNSPEPELRNGNDWPIFLGPHGTGISDETGLLDEFPESGPKLVWELRIGKGYSSPSLRGNQLVIHHRKKDVDVVECLNAEDASSIWKYEYETDFRDPYGYSNGPRCSPLLTEDRCYTYGAQGKLICFNLKTGEVIWQRDTAV